MNKHEISLALKLEHMHKSTNKLPNKLLVKQAVSKIDPFAHMISHYTDAPRIRALCHLRRQSNNLQVVMTHRAHKAKPSPVKGEFLRRSCSQAQVLLSSNFKARSVFCPTKAKHTELPKIYAKQPTLDISFGNKRKSKKEIIYI